MLLPWLFLTLAGFLRHCLRASHKLLSLSGIPFFQASPWRNVPPLPKPLKHHLPMSPARTDLFEIATDPSTDAPWLPCPTLSFRWDSRSSRFAVFPKPLFMVCFVHCPVLAQTAECGMQKSDRVSSGLDSLKEQTCLHHLRFPLESLHPDRCYISRCY